MTIDDSIRKVLKDHANLSVDALTLSEDADLYKNGMTSQTGVNVMLALEGAFDFEFPDTMLSRSVFQTIANIRAAVHQLTEKN